MIKIIKDLFNMPRSITGRSIRQTLKYIKKSIPNLKIIGFKSGTRVFDWVVPDEWDVKDAYIKDKYGKKVVDFNKNLLSIVYQLSLISC